MFDAAALLGLYAETPVHAGSGSTTSEIDLPLQREVHTGLPIIQSTSLKGVLNTGDDENFGRPEFGGALAPTDARLLLFPLRSLDEVFVWATCPLAIERFRRDTALAKVPIALPATGAFDQLDGRDAWVGTASRLPAESTLVFEDEAFESQALDIVDTLASAVEDLLPDSDGYAYFRQRVKTHLVILPDDHFAHLTYKGSSVVTRIRLNKKKTTTGGGGNMWTEELLPSDTLVYSVLLAMPSRKNTSNLNSGQLVLDALRGKLPTNQVIQVGGDESAGRGWMRIRWYPESQPSNGGGSQ